MPIQKWEYKAIDIKEDVYLDDFLNNEGKEGWELIFINKTKVICECVFKRPVVEENNEFPKPFYDPHI